MTRDAFLFKWFWYAMAALPFWLLEDLVFSRFSILGVAPVFPPLAIVAVAVLEGSAGGAGFGLGIGLWWAGALPGSQSGILFLSSLIGLLSGLISQYRLKQSYVGCLFCSTLSLGLLELLRILPRLSSHGAALTALLSIALRELFVSLLFVAPIYLLFRLVYNRVGGTKLM